MGLTVYCEAEIACDGLPCLAPYELKDGGRAYMQAVEPSKAAARREVLKWTTRTGWQKRGRKWLCPHCAAENTP